MLDTRNPELRLSQRLEAADLAWAGVQGAWAATAADEEQTVSPQHLVRMLQGLVLSRAASRAVDHEAERWVDGACR